VTSSPGFAETRQDGADGVRVRVGGRIDSGHHVAAEAPEELVAALVPFLAD
jgi:hypothetical protein